jgi:hypothetical protein
MVMLLHQTIWAWEPLIKKSQKGWPQPAEKRKNKIWKTSGKPVQSTSKEGHWKGKERY